MTNHTFLRNALAACRSELHQLEQLEASIKSKKNITLNLMEIIEKMIEEIPPVPKVQEKDYS